MMADIYEYLTYANRLGRLMDSEIRITLFDNLEGGVDYENVHAQGQLFKFNSPEDLKEKFKAEIARNLEAKKVCRKIYTN